MLKDVGAVEYFLLTLPAPYKVSRFRVCFRFQILSSKCFRFHKNLTASASTSLPHVLWKMLPLLAPQKVKCFRVRFRFQRLSSKCFRFYKNLTASTASASSFRFHIPGLETLWTMKVVEVCHGRSTVIEKIVLKSSQPRNCWPKTALPVQIN